MVNEESKTTREDIQLVEVAWLEVTWCHALHLWPFSLTEINPRNTTWLVAVFLHENNSWKTLRNTPRAVVAVVVACNHSL
jgi:hypothetical protein